MEDLRFTKMTGAGNDFIVIDNRDGAIPEEGRRALFEKWCRRRLDVGADGVLLVERPEGSDADFRMRYYNADGGEAESCGNGARCISRFAYLIGAAGESMAFETQAGLCRARMAGDDVILTMSDPFDLNRDIALNLPELEDGNVDVINTGVPHAVVFVDNIEDVDVQRLGAKIRYHEAFRPAGVNANFAKLEGEDLIRVRTYERGVEGETLACGTGSIAVALIAALKGMVRSPVSIQTTGGPILKIHFEQRENPADASSGRFDDVRLEGEARIVYEGVIAPTAAPVG
jgi:diaminopimelate epimerase